MKTIISRSSRLFAMVWFHVVLYVSTDSVEFICSGGVLESLLRFVKPRFPACSCLLIVRRGLGTQLGGTLEFRVTKRKSLTVSLLSFML